MALSKKQKRGIKRKVDLEAGIVPPKSAAYKNKKKYNRKNKHAQSKYDNGKII